MKMEKQLANTKKETKQPNETSPHQQEEQKRFTKRKTET